MKKYLVFIKSSFLVERSFKFSLFFGFIRFFILLLSLMFLWTALYNSSSTNDNFIYSLEEMLTYVLISAMVSSIYQVNPSGRISESVHSGHIMIDFSRPLDYRLYICSVHLGKLLFNLAFCVLPIFLVVLVLFEIDIPSKLNLLYFIVSLILGIVVIFLINFIIGILAFATTMVWGIDMVKTAVINITAGSIIPLEFFPEKAKAIINLLPFRSLYDIPINYYLGVYDSVFFLGFQFIWILVLASTANILLGNFKKRIFIAGG